MKITEDSHTDHNLTDEQINYVKHRFVNHNGFFIETVQLPVGLGSAPCELYGPVMGDKPIEEAEVSYKVRDGRKCASRMVDRPTRPSVHITVIAGPNGDDPCVLYTVFAGFPAEKEPGDLTLDSLEVIQKSRAFWSEHALSSQT